MGGSDFLKVFKFKEERREANKENHSISRELAKRVIKRPVQLKPLVLTALFKISFSYTSVFERYTHEHVNTHTHTCILTFIFTYLSKNKF